jgi:hypothetical protein
VTISSDPASTLPSVIRYETFNTTITFSSSDANDVITSCKCVKNFSDNNVIVSNGATSVTISGQHRTGFPSDVVKYVEKNSSDQLQTPTIIYDIGSTPANKAVYEVNQDPTPGITRTYTVTVTHTLGSDTFNYSQYVRNDVTVAYNFLQDYY